MVATSGAFSGKMQSISALPSFIQGRRSFEDRKILQSPTPISPSIEIPERSTAVTYVPKDSFDSSSAIILAAFLCAIICVVGVSAMIRCRLLCGRRRVVSEPAIDVGIEGIKGGSRRKIDIKPLPATVCRTGDSPLAGMDCPICLSEFVEGEKVRVLPKCCHSFHLDCIDAWLISNPSCPSCRHPLLYVMVKKSSGEAQGSVDEA